MAIRCNSPLPHIFEAIITFYYASTPEDQRQFAQDCNTLKDVLSTITTTLGDRPWLFAFIHFLVVLEYTADAIPFGADIRFDPDLFDEYLYNRVPTAPKPMNALLQLPNFADFQCRCHDAVDHIHRINLLINHHLADIYMGELILTFTDLQEFMHIARTA